MVSIDSPRDSQSGSSTSPMKTDPPEFNFKVPLLLDPEPDLFASHIREFVEYQKIYGPGWITVLKLQVRGVIDATHPKKRLKVCIQDIGLVPSNLLERYG